jgi:hypothetical protein
LADPSMEDTHFSRISPLDQLARIPSPEAILQAHHSVATADPGGRERWNSACGPVRPAVPDRSSPLLTASAPGSSRRVLDPSATCCRRRATIDKSPSLTGMARYARR